MIQAFRWVIDTCGQQVTCSSRGGQEICKTMAIVRPMTKQDWQVSADALGSYRTDRYLCLMPWDTPMKQVGIGGLIAWEGSLYEVMAWHPIYKGGLTTHLWVALRPADEVV